jgi:hypothetical protein
MRMCGGEDEGQVVRGSISHDGEYVTAVMLAVDVDGEGAGGEEAKELREYS